MAPYLVNHPALLNNWITARETALARVRALMSNTHRNEALIRECSQVNVANRSEESRTSYVVERDAHWRRVKEGERDRGGTARGKSV